MIEFVLQYKITKVWWHKFSIEALEYEMACINHPLPEVLTHLMKARKMSYDAACSERDVLAEQLKEYEAKNG
jgi:hypothetical protein